MARAVDANGRGYVMQPDGSVQCDDSNVASQLPPPPMLPRWMRGALFMGNTAETRTQIARHPKGSSLAVAEAEAEEGSTVNSAP